MQLTSQRNITRFTYEFTSFLGWRVAVCRKHHYFIRYFSDRQYGGAEAALNAAIFVRDLVLKELSLTPDDPLTVFERCRTAGPAAPYPEGLGPKRSRKAS